MKAKTILFFFICKRTDPKYISLISTKNTYVHTYAWERKEDPNNCFKKREGEERDVILLREDDNSFAYLQSRGEEAAKSMLLLQSSFITFFSS